MKNSTVLVILGIFFIVTPTSLVYAESGSEIVNGITVNYDISNGKVSGISYDSDFGELKIGIAANEDGTLEITIPRSLLDAKLSSGQDDLFFVIVGDFDTDYEEVNTTDNSRTLSIPFLEDDATVEILGTTVISAEEETMEEEMMETTAAGKKEGGGCLIATAAYGTELAPQVQFLREIRDNTVMSTASGSAFMTGFNQLYYSFSPVIADMERENPMFQEIIRAFITPMISTLSIMTLAEDGNNLDVLGLGISVIALNLGMYIAAPAIIVWQIKKRI